MLKGGLPIGRLFGISIRLHFSWFFIFVLITWSLTIGYFPTTFPTWSLGTRIAAGIITSLLFFASVLAHELMHSIIAQRIGLQVPNITLFIFGGVSQLAEEPKQARDELRMAIAGPLTSLALGIIFGAIYFLLPATGGAAQFVRAICYWLGIINIILAIFNLVPGFPLDGGRVLRSILWARNKNLMKATRTASTVGRIIGYLFIFTGIFLVFRGNWFNGLWMVFIGWFLSSAAAGSYRQLVFQDMLQGHVASEIMTRDCLMVPPDLNLEKLINEQILTSGRRCFPVTEGNRVIGMVTIHNVKAVPREMWSQARVRDVMTPFEKLKWVKPEEDLASVMQILTQDDINQVPVVQDSAIVGVVSRDNLLSFVHVRGALGM
jgi:Zn-dependent protease/predicted transcriptional regulator